MAESGKATASKADADFHRVVGVQIPLPPLLTFFLQKAFGKMDSKLYKLRKILTDLKVIFSGSPSRVFKRFFIIKPLYKAFMKFIRNF